MKHILPTAIIVAAGILVDALPARATTNIFFSASQTMTVTASNLTAVTINSDGYRFTYSQDGYFTGGVGLTNPVGRFFSVLWPNGVQAQAYTAGPLSGSGANITIQRVDGKLFDLQSFTGKILLNTAGAGAAFEIMPQLNGNDAFADPLQFDCTGYGGQSFPYAPGLTGYDTYLIHMWGDFALTALTLVDASLPPPPPPMVQISTTTSNYVRLCWPTNPPGYSVQHNSNLGTTNWVSVTNAVNTIVTNYQIALPATNRLLYFRLWRP